MRIYKMNSVEAILVTFHIIRYCLCLPMGPKYGSRIPEPAPEQFYNVEIVDGNLGGPARLENTFYPRPRPASVETFMFVPEGEPSNPVSQENGYLYRHPNEPRLADQYREDIVKLNLNKPPRYPIQRDSKLNMNFNPLYNKNEKKRLFKENFEADQNFFKNLSPVRPQFQEDVRVYASNPDKIVFKDAEESNPDNIGFKNAEENIIRHTEIIETSTKYFSSTDLASGTIDYETTTYADDLDLRIGAVSDQLAASLLG